jgi:hypothetical protein
MAALLLPTALAGCASTQSESAKLKAAAVNRPDAEKFVVTRANPDVRFRRATVLGDENGSAVVIPMESTAKAPLAHVPLSFELLGRNGARVYRNDTPGLDTSLVEVPVLERKTPLLWVNDQIQPTAAPVKAAAKAGAAKPLTGVLPKIVVTKADLVDDPTEGLSVKGAVANRSDVEQKRLVVYIVARQGARITAAGRAIVPRLKVGKTARFTGFLIGDAQGSRITAAAPPTTLP